MLIIINKIFEFLPYSAPEFLYTMILKSKLFQKMVNYLLLSIIPEKLSLSFGRILFLNKKDPVISSALSLNVYENFETTLFQKELHNGMTVVDIGANIGYYTVMAAHFVGPSGKVIAFEPDEQSGEILKKNIVVNKFNNVSYVNKALSDKKGFTRLYVSDENRGDNRIYNPKDGRKYVEVEIITLDEYLPKETKVDLIKIDVQGAEFLVLLGMEQTITKSKTLIIFTEFWPQAIIEIGKSPEEFLKKLIGFGFSLYNINNRKKCLEHIVDIKKFTYKYSGREYTNIICYKNEK